MIEEELRALLAHEEALLCLPTTMVPRALELHEVHTVLDERAFYPAHDTRVYSKAYKAVHHAMTVEEDQPCRVCGVRASTLRRKSENPYRAVRMETHHHTIEWALANAIDVGRFNEWIARPRYGKAFTKAQMLAWIDHHRDNLWVLCDVHHRHKWFGVHTISGPIWGVQRFVTEDFATEIRTRRRR